MNWPQEFDVFVFVWWDIFMKSHTQQEKRIMTEDTLSRDPGSSPVKDLQEETYMDMFVRSIIENISASEKRLEEIRQK